MFYYCLLGAIIIFSIAFPVFFHYKGRNKANPYKNQEETEKPVVFSEKAFSRAKISLIIVSCITCLLFSIIFLIPFCLLLVGGKNTDSQGVGWWLLFTVPFLGPFFLISSIGNALLGKHYRKLKKAMPKSDPAPIEIAKPSHTITPLLQSILDGNKEAAEKALKKYPDYINIPYASNGNTPLHVAVWNGHKDIVELLLAQPAIDTQLKNKNGKTALDLAQEKNLTEIVNLLQNR